MAYRLLLVETDWELQAVLSRSEVQPLKYRLESYPKGCCSMEAAQICRAHGSFGLSISSFFDNLRSGARYAALPLKQAHSIL
jgi:hypothetical protein